MSSQRPHEVPDILLEQLLLGELSADEERKLRARLAPEELEQRLAALRAEDAAFREQHDAEEMVRSIAGRVRIAKVRVEKPRASAAFYLVPGIAAVALALLMVRPQPGPGTGPGTDPERPEVILIKGDPSLVLYRRHGEQVDTLVDGAHAAAGDMIQVGYQAADARYGAIVSVDGGGTVTLHFPDSEVASTLLATDGKQLLDHSYELDAAPAFERFFFVTSSQPVDVKKVMDAAHKLARTPERARNGELKLAGNLKQDALTLVKE